MSEIYNKKQIVINDPREKKKSSVIVVHMNQDLDEAIKQIKNRYKINKRQSKQKNKQNPENNQEDQSSSRLYFTQTFNKKYDSRLKQINEHRRKLQAESLEKQMKARLNKKIKQNLQLQQKMSELKDLQQSKLIHSIQQQNKKKKQKQEKKFLHECTVDKVDMLRKNKIKTHKKSMNQSRSVEKQSLKDHRFKVYLQQRQKQERQMLLRSRHQFIVNKTNSLRSLRTASLTSRSKMRQNFDNNIQRNNMRYTSHENRPRNRYIQKQRDQQLIIQQYSPENKDTESSKFSQKVFNKGVRIQTQNKGQDKQEKSQQKEFNKNNIDYKENQQKNQDLQQNRNYQLKNNTEKQNEHFQRKIDQHDVQRQVENDLEHEIGMVQSNKISSIPQNNN